MTGIGPTRESLMEDQGKRLLLAVVIALGIMMAWSQLFPPDEPPRQVDEIVDTGERTPPEPAPPGAPVPTGAVTGQAPGAPVLAEAPATERGPEQLYEFVFDELRAVFTSHGGTLRSWELAGDKYREGKGGRTRQIDMVRTEEESWLPFSIGFGDVELIPARSEWLAERRSDTEIAFTWSYATGTGDDRAVLFDIVKTYRLHPAHYLLELEVQVHNRAARAQKLPLIVSLYGYQDPAEDTGGGMGSIDHAWKSVCYVNEELHTESWSELSDSPMRHAGRVHWGGIAQSYFLMAAAPRAEPGAQLECNGFAVPDRRGVMRTDIKFPVVNIGPGDPPMTHSVVAYMGPKYVETLGAVTAVAGFDPRLTEAVDMGYLAFLARPLLSLLQWFYSFLGNWGLAIVFLTILVKLATLYWTTKSMRSMKRMAKLKPKIEALQKKYKDDRQRQQVEMMNLYKAHKINPLAGCLPMLLQMPIWFALYKMLMTAAELYNAPFIPGWIDDLTSEDPYYIMPIVLMGMMFLQAKFSPTTGDSMQQKVMMYALPLTFGVFSFFFPSGLTLYILTNTVLTALHQLWMNRTDPVEPAVSGGAVKAKAGALARKGDEEVRGEESSSQIRGEDAGEDEDAGAPESSSSKTARKRSGQKKRSGKSRKRGGAS
jgi:YidC/Oxa1 family membrane protein insertase